LKAPCDRPEINDRLLIYLEGGVPAEERETIKLHAKGCASCREELQQLREILGTVKTHAAVIRSSCIAPEVLVDYAEPCKPLAASLIKSIETHLSLCPTCKKEYDCLMQLQEEKVPQPDFIEMAQGEKEFLHMVSRQRSLAARFLTDLIRKIEAVTTQWKEQIQDWSAGIFSPQPQLVIVRKAKRKAGEHILVIKERSQGIEVRIEIEPIGSDHVELLVFLKSPRNNRLLEGMRASIIQEGTERVSFMVRDGKAVFKRLPHNTYELALLKEGKEIKRIQFTTR